MTLPPGPPDRTHVVDDIRYWLAIGRDSVGFVRDRFDAYGDAYWTVNRGSGLLVVRHPDHNREILATKANSFVKGLDDLVKILGNGLLTSDGDLWRRQRRLIQPAFHRKMVTTYADAMLSLATATFAGWRDGQELDLLDEMNALTLRIVCKALFDYDVAADVERVRAGVDAIAAAQRGLDLLPGWVPTPRRRRTARGRADLIDLIDDLVASRRADPDPPADLLTALLHAEDDGGGMVDSQLRDELITLFLAGHETTSNALAWTLWLLSQHPDVEARLHDEVDTVLAGRAPTLDDVPRLVFTDQVLHESLRLYPPAYVIGRRAVEDVQIGEWTVPAGSDVLVWLYFTHRDPRWFDDPDAFRPDRFAPEADPPPAGAFIPFGIGPRKCIGEAFAMLELRLVLAAFAQRFSARYIGARPVRPVHRVTMSPDALPVRLVARRRPAHGVEP